MSEAQYEYETTQELRDLLLRASQSPTVPGGHYSTLACEQLDALQIDPGVRDFDAVLRACVSVLAEPAQARERSDEISTDRGPMHRLQVAIDPPHKVFWTSLSPHGPRVEAIFSHIPKLPSTSSLAGRAGAGPAASLADAGLSAAESDVSEVDWERLREELLAQHPVCPDCGAEWDFDSAIEEDEGEIHGRRAIAITVDCSAVIDSGDDDDDVEIHPSNGGWVQRRMYLDAET